MPTRKSGCIESQVRRGYLRMTWPVMKAPNIRVEEVTLPANVSTKSTIDEKDMDLRRVSCDSRPRWAPYYQASEREAVIKSITVTTVTQSILLGMVDPTNRSHTPPSGGTAPPPLTPEQVKRVELNRLKGRCKTLFRNNHIDSVDNKPRKSKGKRRRLRRYPRPRMSIINGR